MRGSALRACAVGKSEDSAGSPRRRGKRQNENNIGHAGGVGLTALPGDGVGEDGEGLREIHVLHDDALGDGKLG